eukprot:151710-Amphidinium_carterae.1
MEKGHIPKRYGPEAKKLINAVVFRVYGKPQQKRPSKVAASSVKAKGAAQVMGSATSALHVPAAPKADA